MSRLRGRDERGFALIELLIAILVINIGILAILATLNSGMVTLRRSAESSTASAIADRQLERFRGLEYEDVYLDSASLGTVDATYTGDAAHSASQVTGTCSPLTAACTPSQSVTGPDGRSYRIDTYIVWSTDAARDPVKQVTVVVRRGDASLTLARVVSTFGENF